MTEAKRISTQRSKMKQIMKALYRDASFSNSRKKNDPRNGKNPSPLRVLLDSSVAASETNLTLNPKP
jgi:hypothetical protein